MPKSPPSFRPSYQPTPEQHSLEYERGRGSAAARGYGRRWQKLRASVLAVEPLCRACAAEGRAEAATVVDHIRPHKGDEALLYDVSNLQPLCHSCHASKTNRDGSIGSGIGRLKT